MSEALIAYIVEHSDDGGATWGIQAIDWSPEAALRSARGIPWSIRLREVEVKLGDLVSGRIVSDALDDLEKLESILS